MPVLGETRFSGDRMMLKFRAGKIHNFARSVLCPSKTLKRDDEFIHVLLNDRTMRSWALAIGVNPRFYRATYWDPSFAISAFG